MKRNDGVRTGSFTHVLRLLHGQKHSREMVWPSSVTPGLMSSAYKWVDINSNFQHSQPIRGFFCSSTDVSFINRVIECMKRVFLFVYIAVLQHCLYFHLYCHWCMGCAVRWHFGHHRSVTRSICRNWMRANPFSVSLNVRKCTYKIPLIWRHAKFRTLFTTSKKPLDDNQPWGRSTRRPQNWSSTLKAALSGDHKNGRWHATG